MINLSYCRTKQLQIEDTRALNFIDLLFDDSVDSLNIRRDYRFWAYDIYTNFFANKHPFRISKWQKHHYTMTLNEDRIIVRVDWSRKSLIKHYDG